jgi:hypothetical protein
VAAPIVIVLLTIAGLTWEPSRPATLRLLEENQPVELLTFVFLALAGVLGLALARRALRDGGRWAGTLFAMFAAAMLFTAMEEIAWGQYFFHFTPPSFISRLNVKNEMTIHNLPWFDSRTEILRVLFGVAGLIGVRLSSVPAYRRVAAPPFMTSWFVTILVLAVPDFVNDFLSLGDGLDDLLFHLNELNEMLIGMAAALYAWSRLRRS